MGSRLNALNFVDSIFNNKVYPELQKMSVYGGAFVLSQPGYPVIFQQRQFLSYQGTPINDEGVGIADESLPGSYWVGIRASSRDTLTSFRGLRIRTTAITVVMGVDSSKLYVIHNSELSRGDINPLNIPHQYENDNSITEDRKKEYAATLERNERRVAFEILEFLERRSMVYFRQARRLRNEISMSDEYRTRIAYRRFTVIINA